MFDNDHSIGTLATLAGISVRTLHHYDDIGLLRSSGRTAAGHRRYDDADVARLRRILFYRELDFGLDAIAAMLADGDVDRHLREQLRLLRDRIDRDGRLIAALEKEMEARMTGMSLTPEEQLEVFGTDKVGGEWADEARDRWGDTETYRESQRRAATYTKDDWIRIKSEGDAGLRAFADAMAASVPAESDAGRALAEEHRAYLSRWFYDCDHALHRSLADMYVADERFTATFDIVAPGLARYVHDAIIANADAHSA